MTGIAGDRIEAQLLGGAAAVGWTVAGARWREHLNEPYAVTLDLSSADPELEAMPLLGTSVELTLGRRAVVERVAGIVTEVREGLVQTEGAHAVLRIEPALAATRHKVDTRIFQHMTVPAILEQVLGEDLGAFGRTLSNELSRSYPTREYTVQYDETDYDFAHRLMEEEGIVYWFRQEGGPERMVLCDRNGAHPSVRGETAAVLRYSGAWGAGMDAEEAVRAFEDVGRITGTKVTARTFDWTHPTMPVEASVEGGGAGPVLESYVVGGATTFGEFSELGFGSHDVAAQTQLRRELQVRDQSLAEGLGTSLALRCGHRFELAGHPRIERDREYLLVFVEHRYLGEAEGEGVPTGVEYHHRFGCIASDVQWRPDRVRDRPRIPGVQTATVVGPAGEEIHTDPHGRVKVQFHWDRLGKNDDKSSCWIRVMQSMGGPGWGFTFVPRIGMEVVVTFVNGDPDQPLVTGAVFNGANPLALDFPANKTRMTIKSNSSPGGGGFNELRFEDKAGGEEIYLQGEKDWNTLIKHDHNRLVGNDEGQEVVKNRRRKVGGDETVEIDQNMSRAVAQNKNETVGGNRTRQVALVESVTVGVDRHHRVGNDETVKVGSNRNDSIGANLVQTIGQTLAQTVTLGAVVNVGLNHVLNVSQSTIKSVVADEVKKIGGKVKKEVGESVSNKIGKDLEQRIKANETCLVGQNRTATITLNDTLSVGAVHKVTVTGAQTVDVGSQAITVKEAAALTVGAGLTIKVTGAHGLEVSEGASWKMKTLTIEVAEKLALKVGKASLTIEGDNITFDTPGAITLKAAKALTTEGKAGVAVKSPGGTVAINGGPLVKINC